jgi:Chlamydia polymorphic membrane protein (Chlamydia_PMP) repeat
VAHGASVSLSGLGSSNVTGSLQFTWTVSSAGSPIAQLSGANPVFVPPTAYAPGSVFSVTLRVTDASGDSVTAATTTITLTSPIYADSQAIGADNGTSWNDAYTSLQQALSAVNSGSVDTIEVAQGTYSPGTTATATFQLINDVTILGGYAGVGTPDPDARDVSSYVTTLTGGGTCYHVLTGSGTNSTAVLDGFTITGGNADGTGTGQDNGGGIYITNGSPAINDCTFSGNSAGNSKAAGGGGAIYCLNSSSTITNCIIDGNNTTFSGGGLKVGAYETTELTLVNCLFFGNSARNGGAITNSGGGIINLINCTITKNVASASGGAIDEMAGFSIITNCILWGDSARIVPETDNFDVPTDSDEMGGASGVGDINADPLFVSSTDLELQRGSPCINAGSNAAVPAGVTADLAGYPRIVGGTVDMGAYEAPLYATPAFSGVTVNDGNPQRSMVDSLTVTFNEPVILADGAITLSTPGGQAISFQQSTSDDQNYVITFVQDRYLGNSLPDGQYILTVHAAGVTDPYGNTLSGDQSFGFYRLYGDFNGTGEVDLTSLVVIASNYGANSNSPGFEWYWDINGDGVIDLSELVAVASRFGDSLSAPAVPSSPVPSATPVSASTPPTVSTPAPFAPTVVQVPPTETVASPPVARLETASLPSKKPPQAPSQVAAPRLQQKLLSHPTPAETTINFSSSAPITPPVTDDSEAWLKSDHFEL